MRRIGKRWAGYGAAATLLLAGVGGEAQRRAARFEVTETSIAETEAALRSGQVTCHEIVAAYEARIAAYDQAPVPVAEGRPKRMNALVLVNPEAMADADRLDAEWKRTRKLRPLHCVAVIVKDNYDTAGLQTTAGSLALKGFRPTEDAGMVKRLRAAGAVVLAKSNMAEWAFSPYLTESSVAGITRNPYDLTRVPAGSSGGTAAAVATSLGEVGLGTDTGNSVRGPSSHNMLVGIRPTIGLTSRDGIVPLFLNADVGGPMARTVADAAALLTAVAGYDPADPVTEMAKSKAGLDYTKFLDRDGLKGARIAVFRRYVDAKTGDPEVKALVERAIGDLRAQGAEVVDPFDLADFEALTKEIGCGDFRADVNAYLKAHGEGAPYATLDEIVASGLFLPYIEDQMRGAVKPKSEGGRERGEGDEPCVDAYHDRRKTAFREALLKAMDAARVDAVVYPTWSNAPRVVGDRKSPAGDNSQILSPMTGFPAITVPMGLTHGSLPAGLTFLGRTLDEGRLIRLAYGYEQATRWRKPPAGFGPLK